MRVDIGTIQAVHKGFLEVNLKSPSQLIKNVVKLTPLNLTEREQRFKIAVGTEVLVLTDELNNHYALGATMIGQDKTHENDNIVQILLDFMDAVANTKTTIDNEELTEKANILALKAKLQAFKE